MLHFYLIIVSKMNTFVLQYTKLLSFMKQKNEVHMENWIKELDYKAEFTDEYNEIIELIGFENFVKLFARFRKSNIYFSEAPLNQLRKKYIVKYETELKDKNIPIKKIARLLGVSERFIRNTLNGERE
jgi:hypothetical protein